MLVQLDKKVFPNLIPPCPDDQSFSVENYANLVAWAKDLTLVLHDLNNKLTLAYNAHISNPDAHPEMRDAHP